MFHRLISGILGLIVLAAGGMYESAAVPDFSCADIPLFQTISVVTVLGAIVLLAVYLGFRFLKFALFGPKSPA